MRIGFEIEAVLEGAGLALVAIDRHQPRAGLAQHRAPFAPGREAGAAETAQDGVVERLQQIFLRQFAGAQTVQQRVTAAGNIGIIVDIVRQMRVGLAGLGGGEHVGNSGVIDKVMPDLGRRRGIAAADTGRAHHANAGAGLVLQLLQQFFRAQHRAGQRVADADGQRRDIRLAFLHDVEMRVEGRGLEHFGERQLHLVGQGCEMRGGNLVIGVLDQVQMLDQEIAAPRPVAEQMLDLVGGGGTTWRPLGVDFARLRPSPGCSNGRTFCTSWSIENSVPALPLATLIRGMPDAKRKLNGPVLWSHAAHAISIESRSKKPGTVCDQRLRLYNGNPEVPRTWAAMKQRCGTGQRDRPPRQERNSDHGEASGSSDCTGRSRILQIWNQYRASASPKCPKTATAQPSSGSVSAAIAISILKLASAVPGVR